MGVNFGRLTFQRGDSAKTEACILESVNRQVFGGPLRPADE